ncbi:hypothetical protein RRG08_007744 [Elysia crispata]|uniref:Uncharacterized protein n=1 Tax=Elysia crispata TaxID=231223 RepID=A0AAE1A4L4_9GAST|nr:hypothetical protein RRG08_007744 [Elysia crispata]
MGSQNNDISTQQNVGSQDLNMQMLMRLAKTVAAGTSDYADGNVTSTDDAFYYSSVSGCQTVQSNLQGLHNDANQATPLGQSTLFKTVCDSCTSPLKTPSNSTEKRHHVSATSPMVKGSLFTLNVSCKVDKDTNYHQHTNKPRGKVLSIHLMKRKINTSGNTNRLKVITTVSIQKSSCTKKNVLFNEITTEKKKGLLS